MSGWVGGLAEWVEENTAYLSVVFSWRLPEAYQKAIWYKGQGYRVRVGGPALFVNTNQKYMLDVAEIGGAVDAITHHNPQATIASRGCPVGCYFCIVPKMEGKAFTFLWDFIPRTILCDNNLSALPVEYQDHIIRRYKETDTPLLDANSGFEPHTFDEDTYHRWKEINKGPWRFALDEMGELEDVRRMMVILKDEPGSSKRVYVLIGNEPIASCHERILKVIEWGGEPHCQPVMTLTTLEKRPQVRYDWTEEKLHDMARWANRWIWRTVPLEEYRPTQGPFRPFENQIGSGQGAGR
jgi:hypothetical protein